MQARHNLNIKRESRCEVLLLSKEAESVFFKGVALLQWKAMYLRIYGQHKLDVMDLQNTKEEGEIEGVRNR